MATPMEEINVNLRCLRGEHTTCTGIVFRVHGDELCECPVPNCGHKIMPQDKEEQHV